MVATKCLAGKVLLFEAVEVAREGNCQGVASGSPKAYAVVSHC